MREKRERVLGIKSIALVDASKVRHTLPDLEEFHAADEIIAEKELRKLMQVESPRKGGVSQALAFDDLTGMKLDAKGVQEARRKEI